MDGKDTKKIFLKGKSQIFYIIKVIILLYHGSYFKIIYIIGILRGVWHDFIKIFEKFKDIIFGILFKK